MAGEVSKDITARFLFRMTLQKRMKKESSTSMMQIILHSICTIVPGQSGRYAAKWSCHQ